uniref:SEA domain-containing protein n=1 Tax=Angiostrongylus cantonensis TaxID=6313 RepID=A0A0K0CU60_ANGCA
MSSRNFLENWRSSTATETNSENLTLIGKMVSVDNFRKLSLTPLIYFKYSKGLANTEASKWTAAFRRIVLQSITRTIQVEFVGAPPRFCFEEYEVRLLDETGIELLYHAVIKAKDMRKEIIDGKMLYFGEYNFTGLEYGIDYIPSVIPVEISSDGRCLCPTSEQHGACSCIAADWKRVRLQRELKN